MGFWVKMPRLKELEAHEQRPQPIRRRMRTGSAPISSDNRWVNQSDRLESTGARPSQSDGGRELHLIENVLLQIVTFSDFDET
jgi:hypothetical protein